MNEVCAVRGCETPLSGADRHESADGGWHTPVPLSRVLDRVEHLERVFAAVYDLDRCAHGRHQRDICNDCSRETLGESSNRGNPHRLAVCGFDRSGRPITPYSLHQLTAPEDSADA